MTDATCSVCGGPPRLAVGHDLPAMITSATGFCLCGACAINSLFPAAQAAGAAPAAAPKAYPQHNNAAEEEVAAELEKLLGPAPGADTPDASLASSEQDVTEAELIAAMDDLASKRSTPSAARASAPAAVRAPAAPKRTKGGLTEEEVAAELEKLMGPAPGAATAVRSGESERGHSAGVTEAELVAALDDLMSQRSKKPTRAPTSVTHQRRLSPQGVAAMLNEMTGSDAA